MIGLHARNPGGIKSVHCQCTNKCDGWSDANEGGRDLAEGKARKSRRKQCSSALPVH